MSKESAAASTNGTAVGLDQLRMSLCNGTVLDLRGGPLAADLIRDALLGKLGPGEAKTANFPTEFDPRGLRITNADIQGHLDLGDATVPVAVCITRSHVPQGINLNGSRLGRRLDLAHSTVGTINLSGTHINGQMKFTGLTLTDSIAIGISLAGDNLQVEGNAFLDQDFSSVGAIDLSGARIAGALRMTGAQLAGSNQYGMSFTGGNLQVGGSAFLDDGFRSTGTVVLLGARIAGRLRMTGAQLTDRIHNGISLAGDYLQVGGNAHLDEDFTADGAVSLVGAQITGSLLLTKAKLGDRNGISLAGENLQVGADALFNEGFTTAGAVHLPGARISGRLVMSRAQLNGSNQLGNSLAADNLQVGGNALLDEDFTANGGVYLVGARITGTLVMSHAQLNGSNHRGLGLAGDNLQVGADAFFDNGFTTAGAIFLLGARIAGFLRMTDAQVGTNGDGIGLAGDNLQVGADAFLDKGFTTAGAVHLYRARVTGTLYMSRAQLRGTNQRGISLAGNNLQVGADAFLDKGLTTTGAIFLPGAHIAGILSMTDAQIGTSPDGIGLAGDNLQVGADAFLDEGFSTAGAVFLPGAHFTRTLTMSRAHLTGTDQHGNSLIGDNLQVGADAIFHGLAVVGAIRLHGTRITGRLAAPATAARAGALDSPGLDLTGASMDDLQLNFADVRWLNRPKLKPDQPALSPSRVVLSLENCTYKHRPDPALGDLETWLRMLRFHTPEYQPRSYQQLAAVHRATGHDRDAGRILMAQQDHRRATTMRPAENAPYLRRVGLRFSRSGLSIWKATLGYGYRPRRALAWLLALLGVAGILVTIAAHWQAAPTVADVPVAYRPANPDTGTPVSYCSLGEAAGLAVRIAIPLVTNLGQGACIINTATTPGSIIVAVSIALQTFAWILGGLTIAAAATAIKRSP